MRSSETDLFNWARQANQRKRPKRAPKQNGFVRALALVVEYGRRAELLGQVRAPSVARATCPRCGREGTVHKHFGTRRVNGEVRPQSWCRDCRAVASRARRTLRDHGVLELPFTSAA